MQLNIKVKLLPDKLSESQKVQTKFQTPKAAGKYSDILTYLISELLKLVDDGRIAFTPAVELSFLSENEQEILLNEIEYADATPSLSQAQRLRKLSEDGNFFVDTVFAVLSEEKPNQKEQVRIPADKLRDILPRGMDKQKTEDFIIKACEHYRKYLIRQKNRDER